MSSIPYSASRAMVIMTLIVDLHLQIDRCCVSYSTLNQCRASFVCSGCVAGADVATGRKAGALRHSAVSSICCSSTLTTAAF
jgi:hypothetical protein